MKVTVLIKTLLELMTSEQRKKLKFLQVLIVFSALFELISITVIGPFIALVGNAEIVDENFVVSFLNSTLRFESRADFLLFFGGVILTLIIISTILNVISIQKLSIYAAEVGAEFGDTLYSYYLKKEYLFHAETNSSVLIKQIATEVARVTDNILQPLVQINARLVSVLLISSFIFIYNPIISMVGLFVIATCYYILFCVVRDRLAHNGNKITETSKKRFRLMSESFAAVKEISVLGCQKTFIDDFHQSGKDFSEAYGSSNGLYNAPRYVIELIVFGGMITSLLAFVYFDGESITSFLPTMTIFAVAVLKLLPSFQQIYSGSAQIRGNYSALISLQSDIRDARIKQSDSKSFSTVNKSNEELLGDIELSNIVFKYPGQQDNVLNGLSLNIPKHSFVGIVGDSGSGKSTLFDILLGVIVADSGQFKVGGTSISKANIDDWQRKVSYVSQNVFLKDGTLAENIAFGIPCNHVDDQNIKSVSDKSQLDSWIKDLPKGAQAEVGEGGVQISGGQKQRIGIARALYHDGDVLFFDEATSALDGVTEQKIMNSILNLNKQKTVVMIAHRLNTLKRCDMIYFVEGGRVIDCGTYDFLKENNRKFGMMAEGMTNK